MAATETYYKNKIQELCDDLALANFEREIFRMALERWELNARDIGWKPEESSPASWLRSLAREITEIPFYQKAIRDLSDSVDRLSRALTAANTKPALTEADIEYAQAVARRTPRFT